MSQKFFEKYFLVFFSLIPISIIIGPAASLFAVLAISLSSFFILPSIYKQGHNIFLSRTVKILILLYLYLIFNSFIALDFMASAKRNFGFIRFILLFIACNYFFYISKKPNNLFKFWSIILIIFAADVYFEVITGKNILGYGDDKLTRERVVSFFKDELISGAFINSFFLILVGYFFIEFNKKNKTLQISILLIFFIFLYAVFLTGERSNSIKALIGSIVFLLLNKNFGSKVKLYLFTIFTALIILIYSNSEFLKLRYEGQLLNYITGKNNISHATLTNNKYVVLYSVGYEVFKKHPFFGVGNKNFRIEVCRKDNTYKRCTTHPHQIYFEFLSEHGLVGTLILLSILFYLIFRVLKVIIISQNYVQLGCFLYLILIFTPFIPGGSFFNDFNSTIFWTNFSLLYASNKKTNIFNNETKLE